MTLVPGRHGEGDHANTDLTAKKGKRGVVELVMGKELGGAGYAKVSGSWQQVLGENLPCSAITMTVYATVSAFQKPHGASETKDHSLLPVSTISSSGSQT